MFVGFMIIKNRVPMNLSKTITWIWYWRKDPATG